MKKSQITLFTTGILFLNFFVTTALSLFSLNSLIDENNRENSIIISNEISTALTASFSEPRSVSMAIDNTFTREILENLSNYSGEQQATMIGDYLYDYIKHFDYSTAFFVVADTLDYFTEWGYVKTLDLENPDDDWFKKFENTGFDYQLNVDNDQANDNRLTIFINNRIEDEHGKFLAACGVGVLLDKVEKMIQAFEKQSNIKIQVLSSDGIIQLSGDKSIQQRFTSQEILSLLYDFDLANEYLYQKEGKHGYNIITYLPDCKWYLVVSYEGNNHIYSKLLFKNLLICFAAFVILLILVNIIVRLLMNTTDYYKMTSETDRLTGLPNRRAYEEVLSQIKKEGKTSLYSVMALDINGLKDANDSFGHAAGDELIKGLGNCMGEFLHDHGMLFRTGGDEFIYITDEKIDDPEDMIAMLKDSISKWQGQYVKQGTVSAGFALGYNNPNCTITELIEIADRKMYKDKALYYADKKRDRRVTRVPKQ